jgi:hypothetical protein
VYDQTVYIEDALSLVNSNIWVGGALATLVLLFFLRSVRSVSIIAVAIPISVLGGVVTMVAMGRTINVVSLAGMAFAVGMVVDDAIVVLENIYTKIEKGMDPVEAGHPPLELADPAATEKMAPRRGDKGRELPAAQDRHHRAALRRPQQGMGREWSPPQRPASVDRQAPPHGQRDLTRTSLPERGSSTAAPPVTTWSVSLT